MYKTFILSSILLNLFLKKTIHVTTMIILITFCAGAKYIKIMLMENNKLQYLDIIWNEIGDDGMRLITEGLQCNNTLAKLNAWHCDISVTGR